MRPFSSVPPIGAVLGLGLLATTGVAQPEINFADGAPGWRTVVDGVMGGRSTGRISQTSGGDLLFTGELSLENNGGFSQIRASVPEGSFADADGVALRVRGDGREYTFDLRTSNIRMMAGGFQQTFATQEGVWETIHLPFEEFRLYSFGRLVRNQAALNPALIDSIGVTLADKRPGDFRLEIDFIRPLGNSDEQSSGESATSNDLQSVASGAGLTTLLELVTAAGVEIPTDQRVTILAPTNDAFAALPSESVAFLMTPDGAAALRDILTLHIVPNQLSSTDLLSRRFVPTLNGQRLKLDDDGIFGIDGARLIATDVSFAGGVVHVIDSVLQPETRSILSIVTSSKETRQLAAAVDAAGIGEQIDSDNGPWTVFAPVDSAFAKLAPAVLESLLQVENRQTLIAVLGLHIVPGRLYANDLLAAQRAETLFGESIDFRLDGGELVVGGAQIIRRNIEASNGVIHLIDTVLTPAESSRAATPETGANDRALAILELAVSRGVPLFNAGQAEACAAIYKVVIEAVVKLGGDGLDDMVTQRLTRSLADGRASRSAADRAWIYRRAIDEVAAHLMQIRAMTAFAPGR